MKLTHVGIANYRSIGQEFVTIDLTKKINVLVGANNCGKSNILGALARLGRHEIEAAHDPKDRHQLKSTSEPIVRFAGLTRGPKDHDDTVSFSIDCKFGPDWPQIVATGWDSGGFQKLQDAFTRIKNHPFNRVLSPEETTAFAKGLGQDVIKQNILREYPAVVRVPEFRKITGGANYGVDGAGIVSRLASWDRPDFGKRSDRNKLLRVRELIRDLTQQISADIEVSREGSQLLVTVGDIQLPLSSYGTGIHELIILAIAVLSHENALVCIEEPEIHLHPLLQRRFLEFLRRETSNRYVITTHSPALIAPSDDVAVTHLWLENGVTKSRPIETTGHSLEALRDLGAKASDLLQANSVIWVEGPSDRIYLRRWLELLFPGQFREGIDYAIMFYGGRLLAHVDFDRETAAEERDVDDLVHLLRINQYSAVLIDSDRRDPSDGINATKQRIQQECTQAGILCWITDGREIENYLPGAAVAAAYADAATAAVEVKLTPFGSLEDALKKTFRGTRQRASYYDHAKPQHARAIAEHVSVEHITPGLRSWVEKIARVIRHEPVA